MSKDAQSSPILSDEAKKKFEEFVAAAAACGFGVEGPPIDTTFAEIEEFGHNVGRMVGRALDEHLANQHANHFQDGDGVPCPSCNKVCSPKEKTKERDFKTTDGDVTLGEPVCHCSVCNRDFFPSTDRAED